MQSKKYRTIRAIPKLFINIVKEEKSIPPTHKYMTAHCPGFI